MKNKLLVCFRPVTLETDDPLGFNDDGQSLMASNVRRAKISKTKSSLSYNENFKIASRSRSGSSRRFCKDLKSVSIEASLQREKSLDSNIDPLIIRSKSQRDSSTNPNYVEDNSIPLFSLCPRSVSERKHHRSSSISKRLSRSGPISELFDHKKQSIPENRAQKSSLGILIIAMTLCITIFWGRVCAIVFTTILLYFLPNRTCVDRRPENMSKLPEMEKEYKRVIMEGWLERKHHHSHRERKGN